MSSVTWIKSEEPSFTRRALVKPGCRDPHKTVDPAWLRRNADALSACYRYWDGETESYPGRWVVAGAPNLRAAKRAARELVESGKARHGCNVYLSCYAWRVLGNERSFQNVWDYGRYTRD